MPQVLVKNYHLPRSDNIECYIHRIRRTGRYGKAGLSINLVSKYEEDTQNIMFSYRMDGKLYSKILSQPKKRVAEDAAEDAAKYESKVVKQAQRKMVRAKGPT